MAQGVFAVYRGFWDDPDFLAQPFTQRECWLWMISEACFGPRRRRGSDDRPIVLERGEFSHSIRFMARRFKWSKSRTARVICMLKNRDMLRDTSRDGVQVYFIKNYNKFQFSSTDERDSSGTLSGTQVGQQRDTSGTNLNNDNTSIKNISPSLRSEETDTPSEKKARKSTIEPEGFSAFYATYPKKVAKGAALRAYRAALKKVSAAELFSGAERYVREREDEDKKFTKAPASWLNGECWADEPADPPHLVRAAVVFEPTDDHGWGRRFESYRVNKVWPPEWGGAFPGDDPRHPKQLVEEFRAKVEAA